jgi:hypothetical protein
VSLSNLSQAEAKLLRLEQLYEAVARFTPMEFATLFRLPMDKHAQALNRLRIAISDQQRHIQWLQRVPRMHVSPEISAAWARDVAAWRIDGGNCD